MLKINNLTYNTLTLFYKQRLNKKENQKFMIIKVYNWIVKLLSRLKIKLKLIKINKKINSKACIKYLVNLASIKKMFRFQFKC